MKFSNGILIGFFAMLMTLSADAEVYTNILSGSWSTAGNWQDGNAPPVGGGTNVLLVFGNGQAVMDTTNDYAGVFTNTRLTFSRAGTTILSGNNIYMMTNDVAVGTYPYIFTTSNAVINCVLEGTQGIRHSGARFLTLAGDNTFSGMFTNGNNVLVGSDNAFGNASRVIIGAAGSAGSISSDSTTPRTITNLFWAWMANTDQRLGNATNNGTLTFTGPFIPYAAGSGKYNVQSPIVVTGPVWWRYTSGFPQTNGIITFLNTTVDADSRIATVMGNTATQKYDGVTYYDGSSIRVAGGGTLIFTNSVITNSVATASLGFGYTNFIETGVTNRIYLYDSTLSVGTNGTTGISGGPSYWSNGADRHELYLINSTLLCRRIYPLPAFVTSPLDIYLNGGTLKFRDGYYTNVINQVNSITLQSGGGYFDDVNDGTLYTATPLSGSGDFYKLGKSQWNLAGRNINTGSMVISNGIVNILNRINNSTNIDIKAGATLTFSNRTAITQAATIRLATGATNGLQFSGDIALDQLFTNDVKLAPGVYSADNLPGVLTGAGRIFSDFAVSDTVISKDYSRENFYYFHGTDIILLDIGHPVISYKMDGTDTNATGVTNSGTYAGAHDLTNYPSIATGPTNATLGGKACYWFDGANDEMREGNFGLSSFTNFTDGFTISSWVYITDTTDNDGIFGCNNTAATDDYIWSMSGFEVTNLRYRVAAGGTELETFTAPTNTWINMLSTHNTAGGTNKFYTNGVLVAQSTAGLSPANVWTNKVLVVGNYYNMGYRWKGGLRNFHVWSNLITDTQITNVYMRFK